MPFTRIEVIEGRTPAEKRALLDAVHQSVVHALKVPDSDNNQRLLEYPADCYDVPPGCTTKRTFIECCLFPGRSREAKKTLYRLLVDRLVALGTPARDVVVVLHEPPMENWGVHGGRPASEVAVGYDVNV
jgi:phenylpyruvate tautomerase PptA (4-oxalocrotonate tautomerase family)